MVQSSSVQWQILFNIEQTMGKNDYTQSMTWNNFHTQNKHIKIVYVILFFRMFDVRTIPLIPFSILE